MEPEVIWGYIDSERASLAGLLADLTEDEWRVPSLCPGWSVADVAAHVISSPQARPLALLGAMIRARGDFDRLVFEEGRRRGAARPADIVAQYRRFAGSRRHPPGTTIADPLLDVLVHGQDIAVPLGRPRAMPAEAARVAADRIWTKSFPFKARKRLAGLRLTATDIDWSAGQGREVRGPIEALVLLLTGRAISLPRLSGDGVGALRDRLPAA
ncbi:MAG TPA: maleylpyruvate isomerase family mycothiol-dependent enzyme [Kribbella sp.]|nr:maleylpyruvate isomerase family mycothiol-dependent enzyme [Kribbella sp.]